MSSSPSYQPDFDALKEAYQRYHTRSSNSFLPSHRWVGGGGVASLSQSWNRHTKDPETVFAPTTNVACVRANRVSVEEFKNPPITMNSTRTNSQKRYPT